MRDNTHFVTITYPAEHYPAYDRIITTHAKRSSGSSGLGLGERDLEFGFRSARGATTFYQRMRKALRRLSGVQVLPPEA